MDSLMTVVVILMGSSAAAFFWLAYAAGRRERRIVGLSGTFVAARHPLMPRTIRQTPLA